MNDEDIKTIEQIIDKCQNCKLQECINCEINYNQVQAIENLLNRNKDLEEDNYTYHQLMRMQNKREYRSKFLKDFQEEYGKNVMPDYDEIYKRYDKQKKQLKNSVPVAKIKETFDNYINPLLEELDENRRWCDIELVDNFEALKENLLEGKKNGKK